MAGCKQALPGYGISLSAKQVAKANTLPKKKDWTQTLH